MKNEIICSEHETSWTINYMKLKLNEKKWNEGSELKLRETEIMYMNLKSKWTKMSWHEAGNKIKCMDECMGERMNGVTWHELKFEFNWKLQLNWNTLNMEMAWHEREIKCKLN